MDAEHDRYYVTTGLSGARRHRTAFRMVAGMLTAVALLLLLGVVSGFAQRWVVDIGDQSWVAILFSVAAFTLIPAFAWVLDNA